MSNSLTSYIDPLLTMSCSLHFMIVSFSEIKGARECMSPVA